MAEKRKTGGTESNEKPSVMTGTVPEYANATVIAQLIGKTVRRVQQLTQEGVLETETPPGGGTRKYRTTETIQRYISHVEKKARESGESDKTTELLLKKLQAEVELKESQGQLHRIKTAIAEGKYIPAEQMTEELTEFMGVFKKFVMNIPPRVAGNLTGYADAITVRAIEKGLRAEMETMLTAFVEGMEEQKEEP